MDAYRRILTAEDLVNDSLSSELVTTERIADADVKAAIEDKIDAITSAIEEELDQELVLKEYRVRAQTSDWEFNAALDAYDLLLHAFPVISIISPTSVSLVKGDEMAVQAASPYTGTIVFLAGYRRKDQESTGLAWVGEANGLTDGGEIGSPAGSVAAGSASSIELDTAADYDDEEWLALTDADDVPVATVQVSGDQTGVTEIVIVAKTLPAYDATYKLYRISVGGGIDQDGTDPTLSSIPGLARDAAVRILMHEITAADENSLGRTKTLNIGQSNVTVQRTDPKFRENELARLHKLRRVAV